MSYINQISSLGPKIWYRFNETAGTPVNFGSATSTVTASGTPLLNEQTDVDGRAIYLNGTSSFRYSDMPEFTLFDDRSFTLETWFKTTTTFADSQFLPIFGIRGRTTTGTTGNVVFFQLSVPGTTDTSNKYKLRLNSNINTWSSTILSTVDVADNVWHHAVVTVNTTSVKLYLDGQLVGSATPNVNPARFYIDSTGNQTDNTKRIGDIDNSASTTFKGWIDEFAGYDYELSAQQILANFNAGASVNFPDAVGTASALMVEPTWAVECVQAADPMTASSLFVETLPSNFDYVDGIQKIISDLSPEQWYKFDAVNDFTPTTPNIFINYGSGGSPAFTFARGDAFFPNGPAQEPRIEFRLGSGTGSLIPGFATTTTSAFFSTEVSDNNFSIGVWFKMPAAADTSEKQIFAYSGGTNSAIALRVNNKKLVYSVQTSHTTYTHTSTADVTDGIWHLAVIRLDLTATTLKYYLDGTEVYSDTAIQGTRNTPTTFSFGKATTNGTDSTNLFQELSHYFLTSYNTTTPTVITNLWNAGTRQNQAKALMRQPLVEFQNQYDNYVDTLNPIQKLGFNETTGTILENTGSNVNTTLSVQGTNYTRGTSVPTKNRYGYNFTNKNTYISGAYVTSTGSMSDNTQTISVYAKIPTITGSDNQIIALYGAGNAGGSGIGLSIFANASGPYVAIIRDTNPLNTYILSSGSTSWYNDYHLYTAVRDGNTVRFFIDGKQVASGTYSAANFTDSGFIAIGGGETVWLGASAATTNKFIDEFAAFDYALTTKQIFEMWQAIEIDRMNATNGTFPMPTNIAGTGNIETPAPMTASGEIIMPGQTDEIKLFPDHLEAFAQFIHPNYGGNVVIDANYGHEAATASAVFHDPQFNIGDQHAADHMNASALMVHPAAIAGGRITVSTAVGGPAVLVMPGIVTIKGARIFAEPARANAFLPLPPAYLQLTDDQWYVRLFAQHAEQNIEPRFVTGSTGESATQVAKTVLKFFDDVTQPITVGSGRFLENDLEEKIFEAPGSTNTTKTRIFPSIAPNITPTPALYTGYFDDFSRKAVQVENIEFAMPENINNSKLPFSLEFSIKTTKANQIIAKGRWSSFNLNQRSETGFGLHNGVLYLMTTNTTSGTVGNRTPHPANPDVSTTPRMVGRKNIADGQWHHVIVQIGFNDDRIQFWVDGQLDRQQIGGGSTHSRLYIMGSNNGISNYQSNFETSAWSYDKQAFISEQDVDLNYIGYLKYEPIVAEPMTATITMTANNNAVGNRGRAIVFYFWPEETNGIIAKNPPIDSIRGGSTLTGVTTDDFFRQPPQEWYGWDLFPVDVTGRYVSELVKPEAYGVENIKVQDPSFFILTGRENPAQYAYKVNTRGSFVDPVTDARRYIDVFNDIDLSQFDAIFFKNYPEETAEQDAYTREEFADEYFNLRERELFDKFLDSLRKGLDTGISLFVTNHQLAIDLGIVDRVEVVTNVYDQDFENTDAYVIARTDESGPGKPINRETGWYPDLHKNNRHKVVNTLQNLTNEPGYIWKDWFFFQNDDAIDFGGASRPYTRIEYRQFGLQPGDEFIISDDNLYSSTLRAVPFENVKAGKVITAFADNIYQNNTLVQNPFRNYATSIAVEPGTLLKGRPTVGKIFVNFTERFNYKFNARTNSKEYFGVDLIQDEFINRAYEDGEITLAKRDQLLASPNNLDRQLQAAAGNPAEITRINNLKYWNSNGDYILVQANLVVDGTGAGVEQDGIGRGVRRGRVNRVNKKGAPSTQTVTSSSQWFTFEYSWQYERAQFVAASMLTRGIRWLSDKIIDDGLVNRVEPMTAIATGMPMPTITADKDRTVYATSMLANARIVHAPGYALADVSNTTLPLTAIAEFGDFVKNIRADVFIANARMNDPRIAGIEEDEIVVYIYHVDPILYLREDIIK